MGKVKDLLKQSGYSEKAIEYYTKKVNVGEVEGANASVGYTGPCGDTMEFSLRIDSGVIQDAKFQAIGCAGSYASGSALAEMIKGKNLEEAGQVSVEDILDYLGGIPDQKVHCALLAKRTLERTIKQFNDKTSS